jgi:cell division protease FtsH
MVYSEDEGEVFLGRSVTQHKAVSDETAHIIDEEVRAIVDRNYTRASSILQENMDKLHMMADALMKYETIDRNQIESIMAGKPPGPPSDWTESDAPPKGAEPKADKGKSETGKEIGGPAGQY